MKIILAGLGGQGLVFVTQVIAEAALKKGLNVITSESHGMAQRGASIISQLKIGNYKSGSILKGFADIALCFAASEIVPCLNYLKMKGICIVNAEDNYKLNDELKKYIDERKINMFFCNAEKIANSIKYTKGVNLVLLGYAVSHAFNKITDKQSFVDSIEKISNNKWKEKSKQAFYKGYEI